MVVLWQIRCVIFVIVYVNNCITKQSSYLPFIHYPIKSSSPIIITSLLHSYVYMYAVVSIHLSQIYKALKIQLIQGFFSRLSNIYVTDEMITEMVLLSLKIEYNKNCNHVLFASLPFTSLFNRCVHNTRSFSYSLYVVEDEKVN